MVAESDTPSASAGEIRRKYNDIADQYDRALGNRLMEGLYLKRCRERLLSRAGGKALDVAAGTGLNLPCFPPECDVTAIDLSLAMLTVARQRAAGLGREVTFEVMDAERLAFPDQSFDTVVSALSTCTFPDPVKALREMARVCKPGGRILLLEHGRSSREWLGRFQDRRARRHYQQLGCRWNQHPLALVQEAGIHVDAVRRSTVLVLFSEIEGQPG